MTGSSLALVPVILAGLILSGCDRNTEATDLKAFTAEAFKNHVPEVEPLPPLRPAEVFIYTASGQIDPFDTANLRIQAAATEDISGGGGVNGPDLTRRKEPLEAYPIDALSLVGLMHQNGRDWAIIKAPDSTVHRVAAGNYIGKNFGEIISIKGNKLEVVELLRNSAGNWNKRSENIILVE